MRLGDKFRCSIETVASAQNPNDFPRADHAQATITCLDRDKHGADVRDGRDVCTTQFHFVADVEFHFRTSEASKKTAIMRAGKHRYVTDGLRPTNIARRLPIDT